MTFGTEYTVIIFYISAQELYAAINAASVYQEIHSKESLL